MSHLTTIINRVEHRLNEVHKGDINSAAKDGLFRQSVRNLVEYMEAWKDYTDEEVKIADALYAQYHKYCIE